MLNLRNAHSEPLPPYASLKDEMDAYFAAVLHVMGYPHAGPGAWPDLTPETVTAIGERADWWRRMRADNGRLAPLNATPERVKAFHAWFENKYQIAAPRSSDSILKHWPDFEVAYASTGRPIRQPVYALYERFELPDYQPLSPEQAAAFLDSHRPDFSRMGSQPRRRTNDDDL